MPAMAHLLPRYSRNTYKAGRGGCFMPDDSFRAGFCGDYCGKCPNYPDKCPGCIPQNKSHCHFVKCCTARSLDHCGTCVDFPCRELAQFRPDDRQGCYPGYHVDSLADRGKMTLREWLTREEQRWAHLKPSKNPDDDSKA